MLSIEGGAMLDSMSYGDIFDVELSEDRKTLKVTEGCDNFFSVILGKKSVIELIADFQEIADRMEDGVEKITTRYGLG